MNFKRLWVIFKARNIEYFRDRSALGWNFFFPFLIVAGFSIIFSDTESTTFTVGIFPCESKNVSLKHINISAPLKNEKYIKFVGFESFKKGLDKLKHHKIDFLLKISSPPYKYWVSESSPNGYITEKIFFAGLLQEKYQQIAEKQKIHGTTIRYIDWLFPGIISMNMMFSALWGVGFIVVRYRKNGVLKRLQATPLTSLEYLSAQVLSRIFLLLFTFVVVWFGCDLIFSFQVNGSYYSLFLIFLVGGFNLSSLGLLLASRGTSEEVSSGMINFITWPMMFLSEVWFSIESAPNWLKITAKLFPLTHIIKGARKITNDGATFNDITTELGILIIMAIIFLSIGALLFSWNK